MLRLRNNRDANTLRKSGFFDFEFEPDWLISDFAKRVVKEVDKSDVIGPHLIVSPVLGPIAPSYLSGGVKSLLLAYEQPDMRNYSSILYGDNCTKFLLEAGETKDITIIIEHALKFPEEGDYKLYFEDLDITTVGQRDYMETLLLKVKRPWGGDFPLDKIKVRSRLHDRLRMEGVIK
jgi:hypothetical protein